MSNSMVQSSGRVGRAIWALTLRTFRAEYGDRRLGFFWAFVEPAVYIFIITIMMIGMHNGHTSPIGGHLILFVATGILPYLLFNSIEGSVRAGVNANRALLNFPQIKPLDIFIGRLLTELSALSVVFFFFFSGFILLGYAGLPDEPNRLLIPIALSIILGFSVGILNAIFISYYKFWSSIYRVVNRFIFFTSGIFFTANSAPSSLQSILYYFPLIHYTEWLRSAYYSSFESRFTDEKYVLIVTFTALLGALLCERVFRDHLISN